MTTARASRSAYVTCESFQNSKQTYQLLRTYRLPSGAQVRVSITHDSSYPRQSSYTASTWIPTAGWVEVDRILGEDPRGSGMESGYAAPALVLMSVEQMAATLVANASAILGK